MPITTESFWEKFRESLEDGPCTSGQFDELFDEAVALVSDRERMKALERLLPVAETMNYGYAVVLQQFLGLPWLPLQRKAELTLALAKHLMCDNTEEAMSGERSRVAREALDLAKELGDKRMIKKAKEVVNYRNIFSRHHR